MITNIGKDILAKYLIGQTNSYASYIALGVGATPLQSTDSHGDYSTQDSLEFEAVRFPISSRGYVYDDNGNANIVFSGEIPTSERYGFSEIGIYSGKSNSVAGPEDSKVIYTFGQSENWQIHEESSVASIVFPENVADGDVIDNSDAFGYSFRLDADDDVFDNSERTARFERPRFLTNSVVVRGDMSYLELDGSNLSIRQPVSGDPDFGAYYGNHIHYTGATIPFVRSSANDELVLAFSVLDKDVNAGSTIDEVRIMVEFASSDESAANYARLECIVEDADQNFATNRYVVNRQPLGNLVTSPEFSWDTVNVVKIYASTFDDGNLSDQFYISLDGLRFDNKTATNPLYGLTGYTVVRNDSGTTFTKPANSANTVEFRFALDIEALGGS